MSKLATLYTTLVELATRTGKDQGINLKGGVHLAVRVRDNMTTVAISRPGKRLGDVEITTFKAHFHLPIEATRTPETGQKEIQRDQVIWYTVAWSWKTVQETA